MAKYKLALSIPTYKRASSIDDLLSNVGVTLNSLGIGIYILDGSDDNDTENAVKNQIKNNNLTNVEYKHYCSKDTKIRSIDMMLKPDCEFLWPCRDRFYCKDRRLYEIILKMLDLNPDIITFQQNYGEQTPIRFYSNTKEYFVDNLCHFELLCSFIIKKAITSYTPQKALNQDYMLSWPHTTFVFNALAKMESFFGISCSIAQELIEIKTVTHEWQSSKKRYIEAFIKHKIDLLSDILPSFNLSLTDPVIRSKIKIPHKISDFLFLRETSVLTPNNLKENLYYFSCATNLPKSLLYAISKTPKFVCCVFRAGLKIIEFFLNQLSYLGSKIKSFIDFKLNNIKK